MMLPRQMKSIDRSGSTLIAPSGVTPSILGDLIGIGGGLACQLGCGGNKQCLQSCNGIVGPVSQIGGLLGGLF